MSNIGKTLKALRILCNESQKELGQTLGVSQSAITQWERSVEPSAEYIAIIADHFKVTTDYLLGRENEDGRVVINNPHLSRVEQEVLAKIRNLPADAQELMLDNLDYLYKQQKIINTSKKNTDKD